MVGGIAVPAIGLTLGWRWAFGFAALISLATLLNLPKDETKAARPHRSGKIGIPRGTLMVLAVMSGCGAGSANAMAAFLVPSIIASGYPEAMAGVMLAIGSLVSIIARIALGAAADMGRIPLLRSVAVLFMGGAVAYACLAVGSGWVPIVIGTVFAFGMGWGWSGLSILAIVRASPGSAGAATGITQAGVFAGAVFGPLSFGWVVQHGSYAMAWSIMAGVAVAASALAVLGHRLLGQPGEVVARVGPAREENA
jgi:predicted MFS family arabinose efflux permease